MRPKKIRTDPSASSLRSQAIRLLARREHSRFELSRKLAPLAPSPDELEAVLNELIHKDLLSDLRYAESVVRSRGSKFGAMKVAYELKAKGVPDDIAHAALAQLNATELERAQAAWQKRFNAPPASLKERGRQQSFLIQRGFSAEVVARLMKTLTV